MQQQLPKRRRNGCLSMLVGLVALGVLAGLGEMLLTAVMEPWIFTVGGTYRWLPLWQGTADVNGPGGTYRVYLWFWPVSAKQTVQPEATVEGSAYLCTPTHESYYLVVRGGVPGVIWRNVGESPIKLRLENRPFSAALSTYGSAPPHVFLYGHWVGADLVLNDRGSLAHNFHADGSLDEQATHAGPETSGITFTFHEGHWWPFHACP